MVSQQQATDLTSRRINQRFIPDVDVTSHRGEKLRFYSDLIAGRVVLIHFMSISNHRTYPVVPNLIEVARLLRSRHPGNAGLISITAEPDRDGPDQLARFAQAHGANLPDWHFLTGAPENIAALKASLFVHRGNTPPSGGVNRKEFFEFVKNELGGYPADYFCRQPGDAGRDCSMGLMRYGNDALDLWGSVPAKADPSQVVERLSWITPRQAARTARLRRGGPHRSS